MATLPLSFGVQSHFTNGSGFVESSKSIAYISCMFGKGVVNSLNRIDRERRYPSRYSSFQNHRMNVFAKSSTSIVKNKDMPSAFQFLTENNGQLKVLVTENGPKYSVHVEFTSLGTHISKDNLVMNWGIFRSDSSQLMSLDFRNSKPDAISKTMETPFVQKRKGGFAVELDFEGSLAPFYLSFLLKSNLDGDSKIWEIRTHRKTNFCVPIGLGRGYPAPLGVSFLDDGTTNFALVSRNSENVVLFLYKDTNSEKPALEIDLDPYVNRSGNVWHVSIDSKLPFVGYGYRCKGDPLEKGKKNRSDHVVIDPYAKIISNARSDEKLIGKLMKVPTFDWNSDVRPIIPMEKLVVYRLHVQRFTMHKSSKLPNSIVGTFSGVTEKLDHFKNLGVNSILLEPIFAFDGNEGPYFPTHFFAPSNLYGPSGDSLAAITSLKEMVKKLHANGIVVFLEVIFTHTAEDASLRKIDNSSYYYVSGDKESKNINALNCNYPVVLQMIVDSLRYWVTEFHIDGFSFINASSLLNGYHGELLSRPPLVEAIAFDPILSRTMIIADSWDPHATSSKKIVFPHWKRWAEINSNFCRDVRIFLRGEGLLSDLATRLCGSGDIFFNGRGPAFSLNFIARNFGLTLVDLVSFSSEDISSELSWNCGEEGPTSDSAVLERRVKQIRNFLFILFISLGVPVLNMGDECGHSTGGSTSYSDRKPFDWSALQTGFGIQITKFILFMSSLRARRSDLLQKKTFLKEENIEWHGKDRAPPNWNDLSSKILAMALKVDKEESESSLKGDLFVVFNAADNSEIIILPPPVEKMAWHRLVDTSLPFPGFFVKNGDPVLEQISGLIAYEIKSHSCALFEARI